MAIKYELNYLDAANVEHYCSISDPNFTGAITQISGRVFLDYGSAKTALDPIRGQGLKVELDASVNMNFDDLYSEKERAFSVAYYRDSILKFEGWLNVDGIFQNWVKSKWLYTFDCVDGLGYMKNLSFVNDDKELIRQKISMLEILSIALKRASIQQNINVDIDIFYIGAITTNCTLASNFINTNRYIKDDKQTIMDCEAVIKDILEPFGAVITSRNGEWWIYKPNQLYLNTTANFYRFDYLGVPLVPAKVTYDFAQPIGSQLDGFDVFHCSENQQLNNKPSLGAFRIKYEYGLIRQLLKNTELCADGTGDIVGWNVISTTGMTPIVANECTIEWPLTATDPGSEIINLETDYLEINQKRVKVSFKYDYLPSNYEYVYCQIIYKDDNTLKEYYLKDDGTWDTLNNIVTLETLLFDYTVPTSQPISIFDIISNEVVPTDTGSVKVKILSPKSITTGGGIYMGFVLQEVRITQYFDTSEVEEPTGETHTFQRTDKPSAEIDDVFDIKTGDEPEDLYYGTIFKADGNPTEFWERTGFTSSGYSLLTIFGEEVMRMRQKPQKIFTGSIFGFIEYMSVITIDGLDGLYMVTEYSFDSFNNITTLELTQIFGAEFETGILESIEKPYYGSEEKPTVQY